ncbi:MAG: hypothetical protein ACI4AH_02075 [Muribaculaceae bacterium]
MLLHPEEWALLPDGRRYQGETHKQTLLPDGLGIIALDDTHFYAGEFAQGKRHGRGFLIIHTTKQQEEDIRVNGSYEEVMAKAHFDAAGRVTTYDPVGHYEKRTVKHHTWEKVNDGIWQDDEFVSDADTSPLHSLPWKWAIVNLDITSYHSGLPDYMPSHYEKVIGSASKSGEFSLNGLAFVTPYDEQRLLFCSRQGHVFTLVPDVERHFDIRNASGAMRERHTYSLSFGEPDYKTLMNECCFDELVQTALTYNSEIAKVAPYTIEAHQSLSKIGKTYFLRTFYTRSSIFMLSAETIDMVKQAALSGDAHAQFAYARFHIVTKPLVESTNISLDYFNKAHQQGFADATAALSEAWKNGDFAIVDRFKAKQYLEMALNQESEYAAILQLKELYYGSQEQFKKMLKICNQLIDINARQNTQYSLWFYFKGVAYFFLGDIKESLQYLDYAIGQGNIEAWFERMVFGTEYDEQSNITNHDAYIAEMRRGAAHHNANCRALLAWDSASNFNELPANEQTQEKAQEILHELEECSRLGSDLAADFLGDIYHHGFYMNTVDINNAWKWYARAAILNYAIGYEKMFKMVKNKQVDVEPHFCDMLALQGTRLGSKTLLAETVKAYTQGRLTEFASEIEQYYMPEFSDPNFPDLQDESDMPETSDESDRADNA